MIRKRAMIIGGGILLAGAATAVSFASSNTASTSITATAATSSIGTVTPATSTTVGKYKGLPSMSPATEQVGSIGSGNLYTFTPNTSGDVLITLYLNNAGNLANDYSYLNAQVSVYQKSGSGSTAWSAASGATASNTTTGKILSLINGYVTFDVSVTKGDSYDIAVDNGSFYTTATTSADLNPNFYATVDPASN